MVQSRAYHGLPFRGHIEKFASPHSGNFIKALKHIAELASTLVELQKM
jgi:hypothetical protein